MFYLILKVPYGAKFWRGKILTNGYLEKIDKYFDEFHKINTHIY